MKAFNRAWMLGLILLLGWGTSLWAGELKLTRAGWYLVHLGKIDNTSLTTILNKSTVKSMYRWDKSGQALVRLSSSDFMPSPFPPSPEETTTFQTALASGTGVWLWIAGETTLTFEETQPTLTLPTTSGWYLLGTTNALNPATAFPSLPVYDPLTPTRSLILSYQNGQWALYINGTLPSGHFLENLPRLTEIPANSGFWIGI